MSAIVLSATGKTPEFVEPYMQDENNALQPAQNLAEHGASMPFDIAQDEQLLSLLDTHTAEAALYGDEASRQEAMQTCAVKAMRELGLPAHMGKYVDLKNNTVLRIAIKNELLRATSYDTQDLNAWERRFSNLAPKIRFELSPEQAEEFDSELEIWADEMGHKRDKVAKYLTGLIQS